MENREEKENMRELVKEMKLKMANMERRHAIQEELEDWNDKSYSE